MKAVNELSDLELDAAIAVELMGLACYFLQFADSETYPDRYQILNEAQTTFFDQMCNVTPAPRAIGRAAEIGLSAYSKDIGLAMQAVEAARQRGVEFRMTVSDDWDIYWSVDEDVPWNSAALGVPFERLPRAIAIAVLSAVRTASSEKKE